MHTKSSKLATKDEVQEPDEIIAKKNRLRREQEHKATRKIEMTQYHGPIPPATEFAEYGKTLPDAPHRIMQMAEHQSSHRQACEKKLIYSDIKDRSRGQWFGFILAFIALAGGFYLISIDKDAQGISIIIGDAALFVSLNFYGKAANDKKEKVSQKK